MCCAAYVAGLEKNDVILSIDKNEVKSILDVSKFITMSTSEFIDFKVSRYDKEILIKVKPQILDDDEGTVWNEEARKRDADRMSPRQAWRAIQAGMPEDVIISSDIGNNCAIGNCTQLLE